jgi:putative FmdB family regulatory protein
MPIYEYGCSSCGTVIEVMQKVGARPLRKCRDCSGKLQKLVSRTSFVLKGGGWFDEGYGGGSKRKGPSGSSGSSKPTDSSKTPSKPEKKEKKAASAD